MKNYLIAIFCSLFFWGTAQKKDIVTFYNELDTSIVKSVKLDPEEDVFTSSYFGINSGLYKFPIHLNTMDYGFVSRLFMMEYEDIEYQADTTALLNAKYDHGFAATHWFTADFARKIGNSTLVSKFNRNASLPWYEEPTNNKSSRNNFLVGAQIPFSDNYTIEFSFQRDQASINETGGIKNPDSIATVEELNANTIFPNLTGGRSDVYQQEISLNQQFSLWQKSDSLNRKKALNLKINTVYSDHRYTFEMNKADIDSGYFANTFLDSTQTFDSLGFKRILVLPKLEYIQNNFKSDIGIGILKNDFSELDEYYLASDFVYETDSAAYEAKLQYNLQNSWRDNWSIQLATTQNQKVGFFSGKLCIGAMTPEYPNVLYSGNHFNWDVRNFKMTQYQKLNLSYTLKKINLSLTTNIQSFQNYIYYNTSANPNQHTDQLLASKTQINHWFKSKWIDIINGIGIQTSSNQSVISVPTFYSKSTVQLKFSYREVPFRLGGVVHYFSEYEGYAYNPVLKHFYQSNQTIGGTPVVDWYFAARLGPADLYVKLDNSFYNLDRSLFVGENYPVTISYLRFGLNWRLKN